MYKTQVNCEVTFERLKFLDTTRSALAEDEFSCPLLVLKLGYARVYHVQSCCQNPIFF
jgi:hypothetical protein